MGASCGYRIRFSECCSNETHILFVTDGVMLRQCLESPMLSGFDVVIIDEAHERSVWTDIGLVLAKRAAEKRWNTERPLKVCVSSATLEIERFKAFLPGANVINISGSVFPVEIKFESADSSKKMIVKRVEASVRAAIRIHLHEPSGDILVFLTGADECELACRLCLLELERLKAKGVTVPGMIILPLYGAQITEEQQIVFDPPPEEVRKVVFSTNVAETSVTINGIGFVIDCGFVKQKQYNPRTGMDALVTVPISKVQAEQRKGRAGRTQIGKCYRLYYENFFKDKMPDRTIPEILRVNSNYFEHHFIKGELNKCNFNAQKHGYLRYNEF